MILIYKYIELEEIELYKYWYIDIDNNIDETKDEYIVKLDII